jgi:CheY-like chemotaxis protein
VNILRVEDDVVMRQLTRKMLEQHGYQVLEAEDGKSALNVIGSDHASIDLVLRDVVMKGMNGPELVLRLIESHPCDGSCVYVGLYRRTRGEPGKRWRHPAAGKAARAELLKTIDAALG